MNRISQLRLAQIVSEADAASKEWMAARLNLQAVHLSLNWQTQPKNKKEGSSPLFYV
ncbi:hypothetical protein [Pseudoalteromonas sp. T1lg48]|uniref:hypothetical protein n=1 Tax=Pseudoalteromonas sp. T1lg48 TaxID=2077100 RepID=UPI00131A0B7D|nr:hypothetical protein [Pseudoalteromonas sp. T1lg48]